MKHLLADRYLLEELIGRGPIGVVWRARDRNTGDTLAVKLLDAHVLEDPYVIERFHRERSTLTAFLHPAQVRIRDLIDDDGVLALAMELVTGVHLGRHLHDHGPMPPVRAAETAAAVAEALAAAHDAGITHCGIKPTNVLLAESGQVRVTDFRIARLILRDESAGPGPGDTAYLAPELARGGPPLPASDVYALGVLLLEMLTGLRWSEAVQRRRGSWPALPSAVPAGLRPLLSACVQPDPRLRPPAHQVTAALRRAVPALPRVVPVRPRVGGGLHSAGRPRRWSAPSRDRRYPRSVRAAVAAGLLVAAGVITMAVDRAAERGNGEAPGGEGSTASERSAVGDPEAGASRTGQHRPGPPPAAGPATVEGATAFVRYWFDALTHAMSTGNTADLQAASSPDCQVCATNVRTVSDSYRDGASLRGGSYVVREAEADGFWNPDRPTLHVVFDRSPRSSVSGDGRLTGVLPGATFVPCQVVLVRAADRWLVREVLSNSQIA
jgi:serine/threonine-protein kinase